MGYAYITFRSVTHAQRGEGILSGAGIRCAMQRTPRWMEEQGCGYCLRLRQQELVRARELLLNNGVQFRRSYRTDERGELVEAL